MDITLIYDGFVSHSSGFLVYESGGEKTKLPVKNISNIIVEGNITISSRTMEYIVNKNINLIFSNKTYNSAFAVDNNGCNSGINIINQAQAYTNEKRLIIAKAILASAFIGMMRVLKQHDIKPLSSLFSSTAIINKIVSNISSIDKLLLLEAKYRHTYYSYFNQIIKNEEFSFKGRHYYPCEDEVNLLISLINSVIYRVCLIAINKARLNPSIAYLHSANKRPISLAYDISELYKPIIGDRALFNLINHKELSSNDFSRANEELRISYHGKAVVIKEINKLFNSTIKLEDERYMSYRELLDSDCICIRKYISGDIASLELFKARW